MAAEIVVECRAAKAGLSELLLQALEPGLPFVRYFPRHFMHLSLKLTLMKPA